MSGAATGAQVPKMEVQIMQIRVAKGSGEVKGHTEYKVQVCLDDGDWTLWKRYREFLELHEELVLLLEAKQIRLPTFPRKRMFGSTKPRVQNERMTLLHFYCTMLMDIPEAAETALVQEFFQRPPADAEAG